MPSPWEFGCFRKSPFLSSHAVPGDEALGDLLEDWFEVRHPAGQAVQQRIQTLATTDPEAVWRSLTTEERRLCLQIATGAFPVG